MEPVGYNMFMLTANKNLTKVERKRALKILLSKIRTTKKQSDLNKLLDLFLTKDEKEAILRRIVVGEMLERKVKYRDIAKALGVSHQTISNVRDILEARGYGRNPGRRRAYTRRKRKERPLLGYYKGAPSIL